MTLFDEVASLDKEVVAKFNQEEMKRHDAREELLQQEKRRYQDIRRDTLSSSLDRLQYLAYIIARRDCYGDLPMGVAELDPVFAIIRQLVDEQALR